MSRLGLSADHIESLKRDSGRGEFPEVGRHKAARRDVDEQA